MIHDIKEWWHDFQYYADDLLQHPFVVAIGITTIAAIIFIIIQNGN